MSNTVERVAEQIHNASPVTVEGRALDWSHVVLSHPERANVYRYDARKKILYEELERRAQAGQTITEGEAAGLVELANQGLGPILDAIKADEAEQGWPDLSCLVVSANTNLPSYVGTGSEARDAAMTLRENVFAAHTARGPSR